MIILASALGLAARAATVSLSAVAGHPGEEVEVVVSVSSPGASTALEVDLPLPEGAVSFVPGSAVSLAATGHTVSGNVRDGELRLLMHSLALEVLPPGGLMSFRLRLGSTPGVFTLAPGVVLSDAQGGALPCTAEAAEVTCLSPRIALSPAAVDFGRQAIRGTYTRTFSIMNTGNEPLTVSAIRASAEELTTGLALPLTVAAGGSVSVALAYSPVRRAAGIDEHLAVVSNAVNGEARLGVSAVPYSVNELHVDGPLSGSSDETVTVRLRLNNMEPIVGIQAGFVLPDALEYVEGSARGTGRGGGLAVTGSVSGKTLTLVAYAVQGGAVPEGDDAVLAFDIRLNGRSGRYGLNPVNVILSNAGMENMTSDTSGGYVQIKAPSISVPAALDFGSVAVGGEGTAALSVYNSGQAPLVIERIDIPDGIYSLEEALPVTVAPYAARSLPFRVAPDREGSRDATVNVYSNDPENRLKTVAFHTDAYEANRLTLSGEANDGYTAYTLHVGLDNFTEITALQMDVRWTEGMATSRSDLRLSSRCADHTCSVAGMGGGVWRIVLFSMGNTPFSGNDGELFSLDFHGGNFAGTTITAENVVLSTASGKNYTSPGANVELVVVEDIVTGTPFVEGKKAADIFSLNGVLLKRGAGKEDLEALAPGVYIVNRRKYVKL